jgi:hypothetical protein
VTPNGNTNDYSSTASLLVYLRGYGNVKIMFFFKFEFEQRGRCDIPIFVQRGLELEY